MEDRGWHYQEDFLLPAILYPLFSLLNRLQTRKAESPSSGNNAPKPPDTSLCLQWLSEPLVTGLHARVTECRTHRKRFNDDARDAFHTDDSGQARWGNRPKTACAALPMTGGRFKLRGCRFRGLAPRGLFFCKIRPQ